MSDKRMVIVITTDEAATVDECVNAMRKGMADNNHARRLSRVLVMGASRGVNAEIAWNREVDKLTREACDLRESLQSKQEQCETVSDILDALTETGEMQQALERADEYRRENAELREKLHHANARVRQLEREQIDSKPAIAIPDEHKVTLLPGDPVWYEMHGRGHSRPGVYLGGTERDAHIAIVDPHIEPAAVAEWNVSRGHVSYRRKLFPEFDTKHAAAIAETRRAYKAGTHAAA